MSLSPSAATAVGLALPLWVHILALWPLPLLLAFHILSVYSW